MSTSERENARTGDNMNLDRRTALKVFAATPVFAALPWTEPEIAEAQRKVAAWFAAGAEFAPNFFTPAEWQTVRMLADLIIPRDQRSGSASDVGVPEFIDFMMGDQPARLVPMREGLAWLDSECRQRFGHGFTACTEAQHAALLDQLAWPARAPADLKQGVDFFISFRNLVLTGFWTSKVGIEDLQYQGNTFVPHWDGCPPAALHKLGVSYE
jgi:gluconate 2-dehydrogenase gamma chain